MQQLESLPLDENIIIDFDRIIFASRSFCHELLSSLTKRADVLIDNVNSDVSQMMALAIVKPENPTIAFQTINLC